MKPFSRQELQFLFDGKKKVAEQLRIQRKKLGLTQQELSEFSGVAVNTIVAVERGQGNPSLSVLLKLAETLGMEWGLRPKSIF